jgi:peptide/nickel transport system substrate-binding protein
MFIIIIITVSLSACFENNQDKNGFEDGAVKESNSGLTVVRMEGGDWGFPQPYTRYSRGPGNAKVNYIFDALVEKDETGYIPWLAEKWEVNEDGTTYTFYIRRDVKWHDGEEFTVEDVYFTFNYIKEFPPVSSIGLFMDEEYDIDVEIISDKQIEFKLSKANAGFLETITNIHILPKHIWSSIDRPDEFTSPEAVIGTGPYILTDYNKEHGIYRFEAFKDFWGPKQAVDVLEFIPVSDPVLALEKGDIHIANIPVDVLSRFENKQNYDLLERPGFWGYRLRFNIDKVKDFQIKEVRQAFAYAIDRQVLAEKVARSAAVAGSMGVLPPHHRWFNADLPEYQQDIEKAKNLLKKAGLSEKELQYELLVGENVEVRIGELIREHLSDIGINIKVISADMKSRDEKIAQGNYELVLVGHGGWARDPDYLRARFTTSAGNNWLEGTPGYYNADLEQLLELQVKEINEDLRKDLIMKIQHLLAEDIPEISIYLTTGYDVYRSDIYSGWMHIFDHHETTHNKLSFLSR